MINVSREVIAAFIFAGIYLMIFYLAEKVKPLFPSNPEISRKLIHFLGGMAALSFPCVFASHWTVLVLTVSFSAIVLITKRKGILKSLHGVQRTSYGGIYYPLAVYLIFLLSSRQPVIYFISILVMVISDTAAALVGGKYGVVKFDVEGNLKSLEGSVVFFFVAFLCIHLPLLLTSGIGRLESVLIALIIALLVTGFEAISLSGSDNIIVPFGVYFLLMKMTRLSSSVIVENLYVLLLIIAVTALIALRPKTLKPSGLIAMMLLNYGAISLCNFYWFLPLVLAQISYYLLILVFVHYEGKEKVASFQVKVLFYIGIIPAILLFMANTVKDHMSLYLPYVTSITAQIAIICNYFFANYLSRPLKAQDYLKHHRKVLEIICSIAAALFVAVMPVMFYKTNFRLNSIIVISIGTWIAYILNFMMNKYYRGVKSDIFEYRRRFVSAAVGVACVFILQQIIRV
ncbi:MAG: hypothetical protein V2A64_04990 [Candidatus Omnitrophota bacterium]